MFTTAPSTTVSIPSEIVIDGVTYKVTSLGDNAFEGCENVTDLTLPDTLEEGSIKTLYPIKKLKKLTMPYKKIFQNKAAKKTTTKKTKVYVVGATKKQAKKFAKKYLIKKVKMKKNIKPKKA